ncbi:MAG: D-2-hydroxyacid dehydrogenase family protein [Alphaproteobacteria bacterium]|nr:D-2-hydroxyacid dehydrogenase family protein [Alphaproteobacteria bacterium]
MPKIAILDDYANAALSSADWSSLPDGFEPAVFTDNLVDHEPLVERLRDFEIVCAMRERTPFPGDVFRRLPNLKLFITSGMRNNAVDFKTAKEMGVVTCGTDSPGSSTVELTWALILGTMRNVAFDHVTMKQGGWQERTGIAVSGKTLGIVGLGKLGGMVAEIAPKFGLDVIAWSPNLKQERCDELGVEKVSKEDLFSRADIVSIHMILSDRSRGLVTAEDFARMKPSAILVNTSRGAIVEQQALIDALTDGRIRAAAVDVYEQEPLPTDHPFRKIDNLLTTPHVGYVTEESYRTFYSQMVENIRAWIDGEPKRVIGG